MRPKTGPYHFHRVRLGVLLQWLILLTIVVLLWQHKDLIISGITGTDTFQTIKDHLPI